jgi:antitoxin (DNA-binding transcriptional repressor) of toxin-antitoxin stability system
MVSFCRPVQKGYVYIVIFKLVRNDLMRHVQATQEKAGFSGLIAAVEAGEKIAIVRRGRVVACLVPHQPQLAAEVLAPVWRQRNHVDNDLAPPSDLIP